MIDLDNCGDYMLLSTLDVAEALKISPGAVRKAAKEGRLRAIGGFRVLYFSARSVRAFARGDADGTAGNNLTQPEAKAAASGEVRTEA
ncbi:helix-turn-helix domain-containing protein [Bradyrhizobium sp. BR 1432]|uniref:helix-turn-helix domain-containing protein n=1 Tax=Bradyrhizobium sp. BR 1432 TaxID=3447966 RepID=UPI003EE50E58